MLFSLVHCDANSTNVSPTAPSFEFDSGCHQSELLCSGRQVVPAATTPWRKRDRASCTSLVAVFQRSNLISFFCAHFLRSDPSVSMAFVVISSSLAMRFFHRSSSSCCTTRRIRNSALQITTSLSSRCTTFSDHLTSKIFQRSCTLCSRVTIFPTTKSQRSFILVFFDSEIFFIRLSSFVTMAASITGSQDVIAKNVWECLRWKRFLPDANCGSVTMNENTPQNKWK